MKRLFFSVYLLLASSAFLHAQKKLTTGPVSGHYTYKSNHGKADSKEKLITIRHEGIFNYFKYAYDRPKPYKQNKRPKPEPDPKPERYIGQLHFNKPKYRPLDTVRFKVYLVTRKGITKQNAEIGTARFGT